MKKVKIFTNVNSIPYILGNELTNEINNWIVENGIIIDTVQITYNSGVCMVIVTYDDHSEQFYPL